MFKLLKTQNRHKLIYNNGLKICMQSFALIFSLVDTFFWRVVVEVGFAGLKWLLFSLLLLLLLGDEFFKV
jgi:hypothetical protein